MVGGVVGVTPNRPGHDGVRDDPGRPCVGPPFAVTLGNVKDPVADPVARPRCANHDVAVGHQGACHAPRARWGGIARHGDPHRRGPTESHPVVGPWSPSAGSPRPCPSRSAVGTHGMRPGAGRTVPAITSAPSSGRCVPRQGCRTISWRLADTGSCSLAVSTPGPPTPVLAPTPTRVRGPSYHLKVVARNRRGRP